VLLFASCCLQRFRLTMSLLYKGCVSCEFPNLQNPASALLLALLPPAALPFTTLLPHTACVLQLSSAIITLPYRYCLLSCCLQRFRFTTSLLYTACVSCEFLTPRFPSHFLLLTAVSNVGRAVGLTTFVSTQPAFQQALCASGNMADLASKTQVRGVARVNPS
jgi:hypothetical protein